MIPPISDPEVAGLFRTLRRMAEGERGLARHDLIDVVWSRLLRPNAYGQILPRTGRDSLKTALSVLATAVQDANDYAQLIAYCEAAVEATRAMCKGPRHPGAQLTQKRVVDPALLSSKKALARASVYAEFSKGRGDDDVVRRAVTRAQKERRRYLQHTTRLDVDKQDPLRALFDLPAEGQVRVLHGDIRKVMTDKRKPLSRVLRDASSFSEPLLRPALGEELWGLCRPVGFADARRSRVLLEVPSSAAAHALQMRKRELVQRLSRVPGLDRVEDVRFSVSGALRLAVRRPR